MAHDLVLPDEYDRINLDLAPFFALPKEEMKRRMEMVESMAETFTLIVEDGMVDIQVSESEIDRKRLLIRDVDHGSWRSEMGWNPSSCERCCVVGFA